VFAYEFPERVDRLILDGPSGGPGNLNPPGARGGSGPYTHREGNDCQVAADNPTWENAERIVKAIIGEQATDDIIAARLDASQQIGSQMKYILWTMDPDRRRANCLTAEQLQTMKMPVLVISVSATESGVEHAENMPNSILVKWEGAGGWPYYTDPLRFSELVTNFLQDKL
jgi:pimeloyl-ACP methyl ester carboxylesterase